LGSYKGFVHAHPEQFVIIADKKGPDYVVRSAADFGPPSKAPENMPWKKTLLRAWMCYCQQVANKRQRDFAFFISHLPEAGRRVEPAPDASRSKKSMSIEEATDDMAYRKRRKGKPLPFQEEADEGDADVGDEEPEPARPKKKRWA